MVKVVTSIFSGFFLRPLSSSVNVGNAGPSSGVNPFKGKVITMEEVSWHDSVKDCWIIIYDRVYDVSEFLEEHPGGGDLLLEYAGREASGAFRGAGHSSDAIKSLERFCIGELPIHESIFRKPGGIHLRDIPE